MASKRIDISLTGQDKTAGAFNSVSKGLQKLSQSANDAGKTVGSALNKGTSSALAGLTRLKSTADTTFGAIKAGANAASQSLGSMGTAVGSLLGGFGALQAAQMAWTGASQREFNEMYLRSRMAGGAADQYLDTIAKIVSKVPGDDTWMNALLTGALARETSMSADMLQRLGTAASKYVIAAQQTGASILPVNAERELSSYIKTGNTGLMIRDGLLKNHVDELNKAKTPTERILALEKAMTEEGFLQLDTAALTSSKWEEIKGRIQLAATNIGSKLLPYVEKVLDAFTWLDEKTNGWGSALTFAGLTITAIAVAVAPIAGAVAAAAKAMWSYAAASKAAGGITPSIGGGVGLGTVAFTVALGVITAVAAWKVADEVINSLDKFFYEKSTKEKEAMTEEEKRQQLSKKGKELDAQVWGALNKAIQTAGGRLSWFGDTWNQTANKAMSAIGRISSAWGGLKSYISAGINGTISIFTNGLQSAWNAVSGLYNYVRGGVTGVVNTVKGFLGMGPARGPSGPNDNMKLNYEGYAGSKKNAINGENSMSGNCVDMSMGLIAMSGGGKLVQGTWNGGPHVWANIGGKDYDPARKALNGTWSPPARGPGDGGTNNISININAPVYGVDDLDKAIQRGLIKGLNKHLG